MKILFWPGGIFGLFIEIHYVFWYMNDVLVCIGHGLWWPGYWKLLCILVYEKSFWAVWV
jgi:hypothetical protein